MEKGYLLGSIVTALGMFAWSKYKILSEREERNDSDRTNQI